MSNAPAPTRATETATITMGLVSIPVAVFSAVEGDHGISKKMFSPKGNRVAYRTVDSVTGEELTRDQIIKKVETPHGFVHVEDHEIERLFSITPKTITVKAFQPLALWATGAYSPKKPYYVEVPKTKIGSKKVDNVAGQQALALLLEVMRDEGAVAVCEFVSRGVPKPAVLLPDGVLWEVYFEDEIRERRPLPEIELPEALIEQGRGLVKAFWSDKPLDLTDERTALIQGFADEKAAAGNFDKPQEPDEVEAPAAEASSDLMALLTASVQAAKTKAA